VSRGTPLPSQPSLINLSLVTPHNPLCTPFTRTPTTT
jgi:hypothetical protein